eukprot:349622-Chlamydomonas_euryale.AAC.3
MPKVQRVPCDQSVQWQCDQCDRVPCDQCDRVPCDQSTRMAAAPAPAAAVACTNCTCRRPAHEASQKQHSSRSTAAAADS